MRRAMLHHLVRCAADHEFATVIATQPFWVPGAQATYDQWVEAAALVALAALPTGGWSGLDYFLKACCPWSGCGARSSGEVQR